MAIPGKAVAFGSATAATAAAASLAWVVTTHGPQASPDKSPQRPPVRAGVIVCAGSDSVLRATDGCAAGQTRVPVAPATSASELPKILDADEGGPSQSPDRGGRPPRERDAIGQLERRMDALRRSPLFTVVDAHDMPVFGVRPEGILLHNGGGLPLVAVRVAADGGFLRTMSSNGALSGWLVASGEQAGLRITEGGALRLDLGRRESSTYSFKVRSKTSPQQLIAGIGETGVGNGALIVGDLDGRPKVSMTAGYGLGEVRVFHDNGAAIVSLRESTAGSGLLIIGDINSTSMAKMGVNDDRYGVVLAGPAAGFPLVPRSGLPGSYFLGCAGGGACRP